MSNILALDLSTKRSGWCTKIDNELVYGAISKSSNNVEKRIIDMVEDIIEIIKKYDIVEIICEEVRPDGDMNSHTGKVLMWLQGFLAIECFKYNPKIKINFISASSWRSKIGIQGYRIKRDAQKAKDIEYVKNKYNILTLDDEADAIGIYDAWIIENTIPEKKVIELTPAAKKAMECGFLV